MKAIAAVDQNWAIGNKDQLLVHIPEDMKNFRRLTTGENRHLRQEDTGDIPSTQNRFRSGTISFFPEIPTYSVENAKVVHSFQELKEILPENTDDILSSAATVHLPYTAALCDDCIITKVENSYEADAWFDNLDNDPAWQCTERGEDQEYEGLIFHFDIYKRRNSSR